MKPHLYHSIANSGLVTALTSLVMTYLNSSLTLTHWAINWLISWAIVFNYVYWVAPHTNSRMDHIMGDHNGRI
jgi:hypothetical protein